MNLNSPVTPDEIDGLVRVYLENEAGRVDAARVAAAIEARLAAQAAAPPASLPFPTSSRWPRVLWKSALAASVLFLASLVGYLAFAPGQASAFSIVSDVHAQLSKKADRCYRVDVQAPPAWVKRYPFLRADARTTLWTRGDRFRVVSQFGDREFEWGQDEKRRLWIVAAPELGLRYNANEPPMGFAQARVYLGLNVQQLTKRLLNDFDLTIQSAGEGRDRQIVIQAIARPGRESLPCNEARLVIDPRTNTLREMELVRLIDGELRGSFYFTLVEEQTPNDEQFRLESHLAPGADILDRERAEERRGELMTTLQALMPPPKIPTKRKPAATSNRGK